MNAFLPYIPLDRRRALAHGTLLPNRTRGTALFVDISGFSRLTEQLVRARGPRRGAEELTRHLNAVYTPLIAAVHAQKGSVIGFSGDAITCWFDAQASDAQSDSGQPNDAVREAANRAAQAAAAIQTAMPQFAAITVSDAGDATVSLAVKTAMASGPARRFLVGDPDVQVIDVLAGSTVDRMAQAEQLATQGETVIDEATATLLGENVAPAQWRTAANHRFALLQNPPTHQKLTIDHSPLTIDHSLSQTWLLPPLRPRLRHGHTRFLAELRPAVALFLRFDGLDYDGNEQAGDQLDRYIRWVQGILTRYEGALIQLTTGDKGSYLYATFGAPIAHGDDAPRAAAAALALCTPPSDLAVATTQIGLAAGRMRVGAYGSETRRTYGVLGDATNLAARLMTQAAPGQILLSDAVADEVSASHRAEAAGGVLLKSGATVAAHRLLSARAEAARALTLLHEEPLVGREDEVAQVEALLARVRATGRGEILRVEGEAGVGKSHLAAEIVARARQRDFDISIGACQSLSQQSPFVPVRQITRNLLGLPLANASAANLAAVAPGAPAIDDQESVPAQIERVRQVVSHMNTEWLLRLPLLGDLLGLPIPDNHTTAAFDAGLRREALTALLIEIAQTRARRPLDGPLPGGPLLLLIEDAHWMDEASQSIVLALARVVADAPILLALVQRPPLHEDDGFYTEFTKLEHQTHLALGELSVEGVAALVQQRLGGEINPLALALIQTRAQGNAFFTEELVDALVESDSLVRPGRPWPARTHELSPALIDRLRRADCLDRDGALRPDADLASVDLGLPDSVHGLVLSRLDRLPEPVKLTLKVASVIGRVFEVELLRDAHPATVDSDSLESQLSTLAERHFARLETPSPQVAYIFKHNITQEAVYQTLLYRQQRTLHGRVARALEILRPDAVERLAHHFHSGDLARPAVRRKALHYLDAAAHQAQRDYANETALAQLDRALALETRWPWLKTKIEVLHLLGRRDEERAVLEELAGAGGVPLVEARLLQGEYHEAVGDYDRATEMLALALDSARGVDRHSEIRCLSRQATVAWRQGDYSLTRSLYMEALNLISTGDATHFEEDIRYGLGLVERQTGDYDAAEAQFQRVLALCRTRGDQQMEAKALNAVGPLFGLRNDPDRSVDYFEQALKLRRKIGDRSGEGSSLLNLAQAEEMRGHYERAELMLREALNLQRSISDPWWEGLVWNQIGVVQMETGQWEAADESFRNSLRLAEQVGNESGKLYILGNLGQVQRELGQIESALSTFSRVIKSAETLDNSVVEVMAHVEIARTFLEVQNDSLAASHAEKALALRDLHQLTQPLTGALGVLARTHAARGTPQKATESLASLEGILLSSGKPLDTSHRDWFDCYLAYQIIGDESAAIASLKRAHVLLQKRAQHIADDVLRNNFLNNITLHRTIVKAAKSSASDEGVHELGVVLSRASVSYLHKATSGERLHGQENGADAMALVLVVLSFRLAGFNRQGDERIANQLTGTLIETPERAQRVKGTGIDGQEILHLRQKGGRQLAQAPLAD